MGKEIRCRTCFDKPPFVEDEGPVADPTGQAEIMGNEQAGQMTPVAAVADELGDFSLRAYIEGTRYFVTNKQVRVNTKGSQQGGSLTFAAADLVGIAVKIGSRQLHLIHQMGKGFRAHFYIEIFQAGLDALA